MKAEQKILREENKIEDIQRKNGKENTGKPDPDILVSLKDVCSMEYYQTPDGMTQVLQDITLEARRKEVWSVIGGSVFEIRLLLEIISNARPYQKGKCVLRQIGMMRKKKVILPHLFYVGGTNTLFHNMNVLEYMMFITSKSKENVAVRQQRIFNELLDAGMDYLSLTPINVLNAQERSIVTLFAALYTKSDIIVWNLPRLYYSDAMLRSVLYLCEKIRRQQKVLLLSTQDYHLAQSISSHILFLQNGKVFYAGAKQAFVDQWDRLAFTVEDKDASRISGMVKETFPLCDCRLKGIKLEIWDPQGELAEEGVFFRFLSQKGLNPQKVIQNIPCVENAYQTVMGNLFK